MYGMWASRIIVGIGLTIGFIVVMPIAVKAFKETWVELGFKQLEEQGTITVVLTFFIFVLMVIVCGVLIVGMVGLIARIIQDIRRAMIARQVRQTYNDRLMRLEGDIALIKGHLGIGGEVSGDDD